MKLVSIMLMLASVMAVGCAPSTTHLWSREMSREVVAKVQGDNGSHYLATVPVRGPREQLRSMPLPAIPKEKFRGFGVSPELLGGEILMVVVSANGSTEFSAVVTPSWWWRRGQYVLLDAPEYAPRPGDVVGVNIPEHDQTLYCIRLQ